MPMPFLIKYHIATGTFIISHWVFQTSITPRELINVLYCIRHNLESLSSEIIVDFGQMQGVFNRNDPNLFVLLSEIESQINDNEKYFRTTCEAVGFG